ncbi:MAG: ABC transporter ATP-binding protein [Gammaproteobacteria bacterium]|nr:ABC transporter ATP-binding protein [Gammaproteobacteria bacterium]
MSASPLKITDLRQSYGAGSPVLARVDLEVAAGDSIALVGMNGAGKTTLIKAILDFIAVDSGSIEIYGKPQTDYRARRRLAFLPEHFKPPYYLKGIEFLDMMSSLYGADNVQTQIEYYARSLDLDPGALTKPVRQYSKGMAQKLGLIACLASGRDFLVLDEPMSGLDPKARHQFKQLLREKLDKGMTLFFSTHLLADVGEICDRMAILHEGKIRFSGTPEECRRQFDAIDLEAAYMNCIGYEREPAE